MNNSYPTPRELRTAATAERLLAEQAAAEAAFRRVVNVARDAIVTRRFPLSAPAYRYEIADVLGLLDEFVVGPEADYLDMLATDMARDAMLTEVA
jgi:hypothetical protein